MHAPSCKKPQIGDLVWVYMLDTKATQWIQDVYRKKVLIVIPPPPRYRLNGSFNVPSDHQDSFLWVYFDNKKHLIPARYLKVLSRA
jgi:hypothetical protein